MRCRDLAWLSQGDVESSRRTSGIRLLAAPLLAVTFFALCLLALPAERILVLGGLMVTYFIPPAGKESLIPIGIGLGLPGWLIALTLTLLDLITALFVIMNFSLITRVPRLGPWITRTTSAGTGFLDRQPWMARWRVAGVALFMMLPLQGTGGIGAPLVGLMAGLTPGQILLAVGVGSAAGSLAIALGAELVWRLALANLPLGLAIAFAGICGMVLLTVLVRRQFTARQAG